MKWPGTLINRELQKQTDNRVDETETVHRRELARQRKLRRLQSAERRTAAKTKATWIIFTGMEVKEIELTGKLLKMTACNKHRKEGHCSVRGKKELSRMVAISVL